MSDYDTVLERLLTDPNFSRALAVDPERALAGYTLTDDERRTLAGGISADPGRTSTVEQRVTKAGLVGVAGLVAELAGAMGGSGSGGLFGDADRDGITNFVHTTPQGPGGGQPGTGLTGLPGGFDDPLGDTDGDGIANFVDSTPQGEGGNPFDGVFGVGAPFGDDDGDGTVNAFDGTPEGEFRLQPGAGGDATIVEFEQGATHEPVVVGPLYDDNTSPPTDGGNRLLSTAPIPTADQPVVDNPSPQGQGHGQGQGQEPGDDEGRDHSDSTDPAYPDDPPPSRR